MGLTSMDIGSSDAHKYSAVRHNLVSELRLSVLIYFGSQKSCISNSCIIIWEVVCLKEKYKEMSPYEWD